MSESTGMGGYIASLSGNDFDAELRAEANKRRQERENAARDERWKRDRAAAEAETKRREAEAAKRRDEIVAENRAIAKARLDEQLAKIERDYLDAGGDPKKVQQFLDAKADEIIASQISEREQAAREAFYSYAKGGGGLPGGHFEPLKPYDF